MQGRSLSKWLPKLLQRTPIKKKAAGGLPDTPPPSYKDACFGPNGASIGAVAGAQRPQNTRIARIVNEAIAQAECKLERLKQVDNSIDIVYISSCIRQLCDFVTFCVDEGCHCRRKAKSKEVRQKNQREAEKLFNLVFATVDWTQQGRKKVVGIVTCAFRETAKQVLDGNEHLKGYWHAHAGFYLMVSGIFKTAGIILEHRAAARTSVKVSLASPTSATRPRKAASPFSDLLAVGVSPPEKMYAYRPFRLSLLGASNES
ncbi:uncharacterized protein PG986_009639 [Apiospora aurea]|uniref:Uncharacterized protein n=1 Tax=Apiospora aurea TaxID=335848 RepID=A0ABR1Q880_9PEZI